MSDEMTESSFKELVEAIVAQHHSFLRRELPKITEMISQLVVQHAGDESLLEAQQIFKKVRNKIETHLHDEETALFPTGIALESGLSAPSSDFDLVARVHEMEREHENCGNALGMIANIVRAVPSSAEVEKLLSTIQNVEEDLSVHVEKENTQMHPKLLRLLASSSVNSR